MKKIILLLAALSFAALNQASAAYTEPAPITEWYFGTTGTIADENTTSPEITSADIGGMLYGVFPEVTLEVGDTIAYTFPWNVVGTHVRITDLRWGLFNNGGDYGTNFLGNNKQNWTGMWVDDDSLQTANTAGNPFNFAGTAGVKVPPSYTQKLIMDPCDGTFLMFIEITRTAANTYNIKSRLFHTLVGTVSYANGVFDGALNPSATNSFNTFALYISANPTLQGIAVIPPVPPVDTVRVEAAADGSANAALPAQTIVSGQSITAHAIARDGGGTFLANTYGAWWPNEANVPFDQTAWALTNITGDILQSDLVVQTNLGSAVLTGHAGGTAQIVCYGNGTNLVFSETITVNGTVPDPIFTPGAGTYVGAQAVTINVGLPGATIYYTTDGSTPTTSSSIYTAPVAVPTDSTMTIKAFAAKAGNMDSAVATASYVTLTTPRWTSLASGSWANTANWYQSYVPNGANQLANFSTLTLGSDLTVSLDGSKTAGLLTFGDVGNTYNSTLDAGSGGTLTLNNTANTGITVNNRTTTITAVIAGTKGLIKDGAGTLVLDAAETYTGTTVVSNGTLQIGPSGSLNGAVTVAGGILNGLGFLNGPVTVAGGTLSAGTAAATGQLNVFNSISLSAGSTTKMRISKTGGFPASDYLYGNSFAFGGALVVTNITSDASQLAAGDVFTILANGGFYSGAFSTYTLPVLPAGLSWDLSQLQAAGFMAVITGVAPPIFNPPAGGYVGTPTVTISCGTLGATIYYTTDGSPPTTSSPSGSSPISVVLPANSPGMQIQAYAVASGLTDSTLTSGIYYTIDSPVWTASFGGSWADPSSWSNNVPAKGANVTADLSTLTLGFDAYVLLDGPQTVGNLRIGDVGNTYGWNIDAGTGGLLTLVGSNTPVITVNNGTNTINAVIAGSAGMTKTGAGILALTADNPIVGDITVNGGVLSLAGANNNNGRLGDANGLTINNGATVRVDGANAVSGANGGKVTPVTINAGSTMTSGNGGHLWGLLTLNGGTLLGGSGNATFGTWNLEQGVTVNGGTTGSTIDSGDVTVNQTGGTVFNVANGGTTSGVDLLVAQPPIQALNITDTGVIKNGAGTMRMTGSSTRPYLAATIVNSGRFLVDGSLVSTTTAVGSPVTVKAGATLGGTGMVYSATFEAGSFAELTLGSPLALTNKLTVATTGTLPVVKVNLPNDVAPGTYPLATYNVTNSSGAFDSTPTILSGSVAAGNMATITTGSGVVSLAVAPSTSNPTLDYSIGSGQITFTWTGDYKLVAQTNSVNVGLGTVWFDYPGGSTSGIAVPIDPASPAVFFGLQPQP